MPSILCRAPLEEPQIEGFQLKGSKNGGVLCTKGAQSKEIATPQGAESECIFGQEAQGVERSSGGSNNGLPVHGLLGKIIRGREDAESVSLILFLIFTYDSQGCLTWNTDFRSDSFTTAMII